MQNTDFFFQAADYRHLFLYIDALAETEARKQGDVREYAKRLDDYNALQERVASLMQKLKIEREANAILTDANAVFKEQVHEYAKRCDDYNALQERVASLEQELTLERKANALLTDANAVFKEQRRQECRKTALLDKLLAGRNEKKAAALTYLYTTMCFLREKFRKSRTFPLFLQMKKTRAVYAAVQISHAEGISRSKYLQHLGIQDMQEILKYCHKSHDGILKTLPASAACLFSPLPQLQNYFLMVSMCFVEDDNVLVSSAAADFFNPLNSVDNVLEEEKEVERSFKEQEEELAGLFVALCPFLMEPEDDNRS